MYQLNIYPKIGPNWLNRQCCLAGCSKTAPRILIFSIAMGADYSFYVKLIATCALIFYGNIISVLASVDTNANHQTQILNHIFWRGSFAKSHYLDCLLRRILDWTMSDRGYGLLLSSIFNVLLGRKWKSITSLWYTRIAVPYSCEQKHVLLHIQKIGNFAF